MSAENYWFECISEAASECGLTLSDDQVRCLAYAAQGCHENYGLAFYRPESPHPGEIERLKRELQIERDKIICPVCKGSGENVSYGPCHSSVSQCWGCHGEKRVSR